MTGLPFEKPAKKAVYGLGLVSQYLFLAFKALFFWRRGDPLVDVPSMVQFVDSRAKYVAQTTLFGYVKTRAGTRYVELFKDDAFAQSLNMAKWEIYLSCLSDLSVYAVAAVARQSRAENAELSNLALQLVKAAIAAEETAAQRAEGFDDVYEAVAQRAANLQWSDIPDGDEPFGGSLASLIEWAPVSDDFKREDELIVRTSMRHKWKAVRDQFRRLIDADAVMADWRRRTSLPEAGD